ncbi:MAG: hypothetical protein BWK74_02080 [Desulfobacteraceae bacterium A6]|nr:MAG: hypothetical protein BWK74_02080 [Desulfobacteraceae bacterium A6]
MTRYIFLSHTLSKTTPLYGGCGCIIIEPEKSMDKGDSCNTSILTFPAHSGTHIDSPLHFIKQGKSVDSYKAGDWVFTKPLVVDIPRNGPELIGKKDFEGKNYPEDTDIVLIKTGFENFRGKEHYWQNGPGLSPALAEYLAGRFSFLRAIGIDFISISSLHHRDTGRQAHCEFLGRNILIIEDMSLKELRSPEELIRVIVLPLRIAGGDGAPVTIIGKVV